MLKADSEGTEEAGITKISRAIQESVGYSSALLFHHARISKLSHRGIGGFVRYDSKL